MATLNYVDLAVEVIWPFVEGDIDRTDLETLVSQAYRTFSHQAVAPLVQVGQHHYMMELFHGPTLHLRTLRFSSWGSCLTMSSSNAVSV